MGFERLLTWSRITFEWLKDGSLAVDPADEHRVDALLDQFTSGDFSEDALDDLVNGQDDATDLDDEADDAASDAAQADLDDDDADETDDDDSQRGFQPVSAAQVDGEFDNGFAALVSLYEAAEAFSRNAIDDKVRSAFQHAAEAIDAAEMPFGWEEDMWDFVCDRAALISGAISNEIDHEILAIDARGLREIIVRFL